jgi:hypothetical protein
MNRRRTLRVLCVYILTILSWQGTSIAKLTDHVGKTSAKDQAAQQAPRPEQTITTSLIRNDRVHVSRITHVPRQHAHALRPGSQRFSCVTSLHPHLA